MTDSLQLLRSIQEGAVSPSTSVSELLRRCQLLAARSSVPELGEWVRHELNGYPADVTLPDYRIVAGIAKGHFVGPFGSGLRNAPLPAQNLPVEYRDWARQAYLRQPIAALEDVVRRDKKGILIVAWPGDLIARVQSGFYENMTLGQAWLELARSDFIAAIESVRNRTLSFAIEAEPLIGSVNSVPAAQVSSALSNVFHTNIYGSVTNLAQASNSVTQSANLAVGDLKALRAELMRLDVATSDAMDLEAAIAADGPAPKKSLGARVAGWVGVMVTKALSGTWSVATSTATEVLPAAIKKYYGIED